MPALAPLDVVNEYFRRVGSSENVAEIGEMFSDAVDWFVVGDAAVVPWAGRKIGRAGVAQFYAIIRAETSSERFELKDMITQRNRVLAIGEMAARVKRTGKLFECEFVFDFVVEDGLITRFRPFEDSFAIMQACI
jgi:ketosteroid isomerase-like protein